ncbi:MAG: Fe-S cluster assembly protein IscX [Phycisphaeraceae bacterium]|nr:MAG: Fe-S cluster assembly protein IscX [Phycisphaeraceae bacterium]
MGGTFGWLDVDEIAATLAERHPGVDPITLRFPDLKRMVESLPGFAPDPGRPANEKILEAIQAAWVDERTDARDDDED